MSKGQHRTGLGEQSTDLQTGSLVDDFSRTAQERSDAGSISTNLTDKGTWYHGIDKGTELTILVFEEGIWITPENGGGHGGD